jgi:hypothetical protein
LKSLFVALVFSSYAAGSCGGGNSISDFRNAAPSNQGVDVKMVTSNKQGLAGDPALMPGVTRLVTGLVNGGVGLTLGTIASVVASEPASFDGEKAVWGPYTEPLWRHSWRMTMTHEGGGVFAYVVEGKPKTAPDSEFVAVITGKHTAERWPAGAGDFTIDWDAVKKIDKDSLITDKTAVTYSRNAKKDVVIKIHFGPSAVYAFDQVTGGDGSFSFTVDNDFDHKTAAQEKLLVKSRWHNVGAGRADVQVTGGDVSATTTFTECWDAAFLRTYYTDTSNIFPTEGSSGACTFTTAEFASF